MMYVSALNLRQHKQPNLSKYQIKMLKR